MHPLRTWTIGALVGALWLGGCGGSADEPTTVALADLVEQHERYEGELVTAEGVVRTYDEPRHYWIEDPALNRVELVPHDEVAPHVGDRVRVTGRFTFADDEGRRITLDELEVVTGAADPVGHPGG